MDILTSFFVVHLGYMIILHFLIGGFFGLFHSTRCNPASYKTRRIIESAFSLMTAIFYGVLMYIVVTTEANGNYYWSEPVLLVVYVLTVLVDFASAFNVLTTVDLIHNAETTDYSYRRHLLDIVLSVIGAALLVI